MLTGDAELARETLAGVFALLPADAPVGECERGKAERSRQPLPALFRVRPSVLRDGDVRRTDRHRFHGGDCDGDSQMALARPADGSIVQPIRLTRRRAR